MREEYYQVASRNLYLLEEFFRIQDFFTDEGVRIIPLKGIALIQGPYSNIGERFITDIDVLVRAKDALRAIALLNAEGYSNPPLHFDAAKPYSDFYNSLLLDKPSAIPYCIHLHWHLLNSVLPFFMFNIDMEKIWQEAKIKMYDGRDILMMNPEQEIVYLAIHAAKHAYEQVGLLKDIQKITVYYQDKLDWQEVIETARNWNAALPLYNLLLLTSKRLEVIFPEYIWGALKPKKLTRANQRMISRILEGRFSGNNFLYVCLDLCEKLSDKIKFIVLTFFPPPLQMLRIYALRSRSLFFFYYLRRIGWVVLQALGATKCISNE